MRRPPFTPRKIPGTNFCYKLSRPQGHSAAGRTRSIENFNDLIGNRTCNFPACSIVPQPPTLPRAPLESHQQTSIRLIIKFPPPKKKTKRIYLEEILIILLEDCYRSCGWRPVYETMLKSLHGCHIVRQTDIHCVASVCV
jgi:hypothetical protein